MTYVQCNQGKNFCDNLMAFCSFITGEQFGINTVLRILYPVHEYIKQIIWLYETTMEDIVQKTTNGFDPFAVHGSKKDSIVVRHMPRKFAAICSLFFY